MSLFLLALPTEAASQQVDKGWELINHYQYAAALPYFEKTLKKEPDNLKALEGIAYCYYKLGFFDKAKNYLATYLSKKDDPQWQLRYAQLLKMTGQIAEARSQVQMLLQKHPDYTLGKLFLQFLNEVNEWSYDPQWFSIEPLSWLNTPYAEFSPFIADNQILFVSDRSSDLLELLHDHGNGSGFYKVFISPIGKNTPKLLKGEINHFYHEGPVSIARGNSMVALSRTSPKYAAKNSVIKPQLFIGQYVKGKIEKLQPFAHNNPLYAFTHPALNENGTLLIFSSDREGGYGGMDLWYSKYENGQWKEPVNLGPTINTPQDEVFPYIHGNELYFSSNGHPSLGGLDIFLSKQENAEWSTPVNLRTPLNSEYDDFGLCFYTETEGFFTSSRPGGKGKDDLYKFIFHGLKKTDRTTMSGVLEYYNLPVAGVKLKLLDEKDNLIAETQTNEQGQFKFSRLTPDKNYIVLLDVPDEKIPKNTKLYLINERGEKVIRAIEFKKGGFRFTALPMEKTNKLPLLIEEDDKLLTINLHGQVYTKLPGDLGKKIEILIVDDAGNVIGKTYTNEKGKFLFEKLPPDSKYFIRLSEESDDLKLIITDESGKVIESLKSSKKGFFEYVRLDPQQGIITLLNEKDEVIRIKSNERFIISKIYYDYDKWDITPESAKELDKLAEILIKNKHIKVELSSHTDSRASDKYNLELSEKRAKSAIEYLLKKGVSANQVSGKGYGETQPVNHCTNGVECSEEEHAKNRRTEVKIESIQ